MLWTVRHRWADGARFAFNCYRHAAQLILRQKGGTGHIIESHEGVTQGDPLSMVLYGIALTPLAEKLQEVEPTVTQPWYADDFAMAGKASAISRVMRRLQDLGPARGYFPEPAKSIAITPRQHRDAARFVMAEFNFTYTDGNRYVGGYIGAPDTRGEWLDTQVTKWSENVRQLAQIAKRYPQTAFAGLSKSLQAEWQYLPRVTPNCKDSFGPIEEAIGETFLLALFQDTEANTATLRSVLAQSACHAGLGIPDPVASADEHYASSVHGTAILVTSIGRGRLLRLAVTSAT